jgi:hypothetical protein
MSHNYRGHFGTQVVSLYIDSGVFPTRCACRILIPRPRVNRGVKYRPSEIWRCPPRRAVTLTEPHVQE